jgi:hypothetical protein
LAMGGSLGSSALTEYFKIPIHGNKWAFSVWVLRLFYYGKTPSYTIRVLKKKGENYERYTRIWRNK